VVAELAPLFAAAAAIIGAVYAALRFNREDARSAVDLMRDLNDELVQALQRQRDENAALQTFLERCRERCRDLESGGT
jgi:hypothetical protein